MPAIAVASPTLASGMPTASKRLLDLVRPSTSPSVRPSSATLRESMPIATSDSPHARPSVPMPVTATAIGRAGGGRYGTIGDATGRGGGTTVLDAAGVAVAAPTNTDSAA